MQESREEIVVRLKERADIVQIIGECVDLKKSGARYLGLCPFHGEKTPSFTVHPGEQFYYCFGCGESGDVLSFMMKYHNLDFPSALKDLAGRYGIVLPERARTPQQEKEERKRKKMFAVSERAAAIYQDCLRRSSFAEVARAYLEKRGITPDIQEHFGLGYAPGVDTAGWEFLGRQLSDEERGAALEAGLLVKKESGRGYDRFRDRILFPIQEISGRICGFGGRIVGEGQPKYLNSPESGIFSKSRLLLGLYHQREAIRRRRQAVVVEGNFDLVSLVLHGCEHVAAPLGTALTREQLRLLKRYADEVVLLFDGDAAGVKAAVRAVPHFLAEQVAGRVALLPQGHDPDTFVREFGAAAVTELLAQAENLPEFVFAQLVERHGLSLDGKSRIVEELRPLVKAAASDLQRAVVVSHFADQLGLSADQLNTMLGSVREAVQSEPPIPVKPLPRERVAPLTAAQKRLVGFMVLNPGYLPKLEASGLRDCLQGSIGEVVFLQIRELLAANAEMEPEELLDVLPEGAERKLVMDLLMTASGTGNDAATLETEADELLSWLKMTALERSSQQILQKIQEIKAGGNDSVLTSLLIEKQRIDRELQGLKP